MDPIKIEGLRAQLNQREKELLHKQEELDAQRGMLSTAIQELIKKNERLENALKELSHRNDELTGILYHSSHGLRTPITSVQGFVQLLKGESMDPAAAEYVDYIEKMSAQMIEIMNSLSVLATVSRLQGAETAKTPVEIDQVVQSNMAYLHQLAACKKVQINYVSPEPAITFLTIPVVFGEIIKQLLMNAMVFRTVAESGFVSIRVEEEEDRLLLRIEDNGDGIPAEAKDKIFNMFFRGSQKSGGSGLGLYIVKKAIDILNGSISVQSRPGQTVFDVSIPKIAS